MIEIISEVRKLPPTIVKTVVSVKITTSQALKELEEK